ncbi:hypothetical protein C0J52_01936, partial [Blattella germanica]
SQRRRVLWNGQFAAPLFLLSLCLLGSAISLAKEGMLAKDFFMSRGLEANQATAEKLLSPKCKQRNCNKFIQ